MLPRLLPAQRMKGRQRGTLESPPMSRLLDAKAAPQYQSCRVYCHRGYVHKGTGFSSATASVFLTPLLAFATLPFPMDLRWTSSRCPPIMAHERRPHAPVLARSVPIRRRIGLETPLDSCASDSPGCCIRHSHTPEWLVGATTTPRGGLPLVLSTTSECCTREVTARQISARLDRLPKHRRAAQAS